MVDNILRILTIILFMGATVGGGAAWARAADAATEAVCDYNRLQMELERALPGAKGIYGLHFIDLESGAECGLNEREIFHAASTFKVPLNFYLATRVAAGAVDPEHQLTYTEKHYEGGTGHLQFHKFGSRYPIARLARDSIVTSDNVATNILIDYLGYGNIKNFMRSLGAEVVENKNTTCPRDMARIMQALVEFAAENPAGETVLGHMRDSVFRAGIPAALPAGIPVADKTGYWPAAGTYNDIAYVQHPARPYILAVYSKNTPGHNAAHAQIRKLTGIVHAFQENPPRRVDLRWESRSPMPEDPPTLYAGRVEVPVRALVEAVPELGLAWNTADGTLTVFSHATGRRTLFRPTDASYRVYGGRAYLPLRTLVESLGYTVEWDAADGRAVVYR